MSYLLELQLYLTKIIPDGKLRGFIPVGEDPSEDPEEVPISLDDGDDGPDRTAPNPPIPRRDEDEDHDSDNNSPSSEVTDDSDDSSDAPIEPPLCCSSRTQVIPSHPDNIYGDWTPTDILRDIEHQTFWKKAVEGSSCTRIQPPVWLPQPESSKKRDSDDLLDDNKATLLKLQKEGGVRFILYLVNKTIPRHDNDLPSKLM